MTICFPIESAIGVSISINQSFKTVISTNCSNAICQRNVTLQNRRINYFQKLHTFDFFTDDIKLKGYIKQNLFNHICHY